MSDPEVVSDGVEVDFGPGAWGGWGHAGSLARIFHEPRSISSHLIGFQVVVLDFEERQIVHSVIPRNRRPPTEMQ